MAPINAQATLKIDESMSLLRTKTGEFYVVHCNMKEPVPLPAALLEKLCLRVVREAVGV